VNYHIAILYEKKYKILKKVLEMRKKVMYIKYCCDMIAKKREVAVWKWQVFRGANVKLGN